MIFVNLLIMKGYIMESKIEELKKLIDFTHGKWNDDMFLEGMLYDVPVEIGRRFQAHGISKEYLYSQAEQLDNLLTKGIDRNRMFYTAPYSFANKEGGSSFGTGGGTCYKDGLFVVLGEIDDVDFKKGIKAVIVNKPLYDKIDKLSKIYPDVKFVKMCDAADYMLQEVQKKDLQQILDGVVETNNIYQNPENGMVGFVPKKGVSKMDAYETLSKLKVFGLVLSLSCQQQNGDRIFVADPNAKESQNSKIIDWLKKAVNQKGK